MSTIGRIFTILNVFLAAAFLGFAATNLGAHQSWKKRHDDLDTKSKQELEQKNAQLNDANAKLATTESSLLSSDQRVTTANAEITRLNGQLTDQTKRASDNEAKLGELAKLLDTYNEKLTEMHTAREAADAKADAATEAQHQAEDAQAAALAAQGEAEGQRDTANKTIADLERDLNTEKQTHQATQTKLASLVAKTGVTLEEIESQPDVRGAVTNVSTPSEAGGMVLVSINKGLTDGVKRGMTFEIWNGNTYKGTVRVDSVRDTMCTGIIYRAVPGTPPIAQGDSAATRI